MSITRSIIDENVAVITRPGDFSNISSIECITADSDIEDQRR